MTGCCFEVWYSKEPPKLIFFKWLEIEIWARAVFFYLIYIYELNDLYSLQPATIRLLKVHSLRSLVVTTLPSYRSNGPSVLYLLVLIMICTLSLLWSCIISYYLPLNHFTSTFNVTYFTFYVHVTCSSNPLQLDSNMEATTIMPLAQRRYDIK